MATKLACLRSKRSRSSRTKYRAARRSFRIRDARKMGREQKKWKEGGGGGERRGGSLLSPPPPPPSIFALAPFSALFVVALFPARPSRGPIFRSARTGKGTLATQATS